MTSEKATSKQPVDDIETLNVSFFRHLRAENLSPNTVDSYQESLKLLLDFLVSSGMPREAGKITREHVEHFIEFLLASKSAATANNRFKGIQQFWKWSAEEGEIERSLMVLSELSVGAE